MKTTRPEVNCKGRNKRGERCRAAATAGGLCFFHANPNKASELGRIGGRKKRSGLASSLEPLPPLDTATAVRDFGAQLIADTMSGKLNPRVATAVVPLLNLQLRAIEAVNLDDLQRQIAALKEQLNPTSKPEETVRRQPVPADPVPNHPKLPKPVSHMDS